MKDILNQIYTELYKKATPNANFNDIQKISGFEKFYYLSEEETTSIIKETLKQNNIPFFRRDRLFIEAQLGPIPCGIEELVKERKNDSWIEFIEEKNGEPLAYLKSYINATNYQNNIRQLKGHTTNTPEILNYSLNFQNLIGHFKYESDAQKFNAEFLNGKAIISPESKDNIL